SHLTSTKKRAGRHIPSRHHHIVDYCPSSYRKPWRIHGIGRMSSVLFTLECNTYSQTGSTNRNFRCFVSWTLSHSPFLPYVRTACSIHSCRTRAFFECLPNERMGFFMENVQR